MNTKENMAVEFTMSQSALFLNGWLDNLDARDVYVADGGGTRINGADSGEVWDAIESARKNYRKCGKGAVHFFKCSVLVAEYIEWATRTLGEAWGCDTEPDNRRDARVMIQSADRIEKAIEAVR